MNFLIAFIFFFAALLPFSEGVYCYARDDPRYADNDACYVYSCSDDGEVMSPGTIVDFVERCKSFKPQIEFIVAEKASIYCSKEIFMWSGCQYSLDFESCMDSDYYTMPEMYHKCVNEVRNNPSSRGFWFDRTGEHQIEGLKEEAGKTNTLSQSTQDDKDGSDADDDIITSPQPPQNVSFNSSSTDEDVITSPLPQNISSNSSQEMNSTIPPWKLKYNFTGPGVVCPRGKADGNSKPLPTEEYKQCSSCAIYSCTGNETWIGCPEDFYRDCSQFPNQIKVVKANNPDRLNYCHKNGLFYVSDCKDKPDYDTCYKKDVSHSRIFAHKFSCLLMKDGILYKGEDELINPNVPKKPFLNVNGGSSYPSSWKYDSRGYSGSGSYSSSSSSSTVGWIIFIVVMVLLCIGVCICYGVAYSKRRNRGSVQVGQIVEAPRGVTY